MAVYTAIDERTLYELSDPFVSGIILLTKTDCARAGRIHNGVYALFLLARRDSLVTSDK